ncbi:ABC transporter substrate-binding protein [Pseudoramibacter sp.]|jgi:spermidine/putrescine-binding protein|uniref:ABC transporter substrate-binding protein n=1 Tax=Pseudoramibacter sp. TaxID=2034862 RepID=UPI0025D4EEA7|nr:extracellular solute-binding protein [Pseudoramibacter sp.]MCH4072292.1 extracellular solute-binding protein [Pseudoramibacter sp.]MCH4106063.1 extracellular solute-binding protein [Pseudoramibacter sp.]
MKRRRFSRIVAAVLAAALCALPLAGCGFGSSKDEVNVIAWDGTWSDQMFKDFEAQTGIKVNVTYIDDTETLASRLIHGGSSYDVIDLEGAYINLFVKYGLLAKIDDSKIPNQKYIVKAYNKGAPGDRKLKYTVPDMAPDYTTVVYNKETCPIEIHSFKDLANPKLKGQVAMISATGSLYGEALKALGYNPSTAGRKEIKKANDLLAKIKKNVKAFAGESAVSQLENGECSVAYCWDYPVLCNDSKANWSKFGYVKLSDGYEQYQQYWAISKRSKHKEAAEKLINFILNPKELAKSYKAYGGVPLEKREVIGKYLKSDYYSNPVIAYAKDMADGNLWNVSVNDKQTEIMDEYYTKLMGKTN